MAAPTNRDRRLVEVGLKAKNSASASQSPSALFGAHRLTETSHTRTNARGSDTLGEVPISKMLLKGWIEPAGPNETYRITPAGEVALKQKIPMISPKKQTSKP